MSALVPHDIALAALLDGLEPVAPAFFAPQDAFGLTLAEAITAPAPVPSRATALRPGAAVASIDLVGASAQTPALVLAKPSRVVTGDSLPENCDAVLPEEAVADGLLAQISDSPAPGAGVRLPGHDLAAGAVIAPAGATMTSQIALACRLAGIERVSARAPGFHVAPTQDPVGDWLVARLAAAGLRAASADVADLVIGWDAAATPRIALSPGAATTTRRIGPRIEATLAPRFDAALGALFGLLWPVIARLTVRALAARERPLAAKLVSTIGMTELALLGRGDGGLRALAVGEATLDALLAADALALIAPECEGLPAGAPIAAVPIDAPFRREFR